MASVMIVDAAHFEEYPKAFQLYLDRYFAIGKMLGKAIFYATRYLDLDSWRHHAKGIAPSHSLHLRAFQGGLAKGQELYDWLHQEVRQGRYIWEFHGGHDTNGAVSD